MSAAGYCGEIRPSGRRKFSSWALLCDPDEKTLRDAFRILLIDPDNTLVAPKRIGQRREAGQLFGWYRRLMNDSTVNAPLSALLDSDAADWSERFEAAAEKVSEATEETAQESERTAP